MSSSRKKRAAPLPLPSPHIVAAPPPMHAVRVVTTAMARDAMPPPLPLVRPTPLAIGHAITAALEGLPEGNVLAPALDAVVQQAAALLRDGLATARSEYHTVVGERKRVALEWNHRSRVTAILGSHTLGHGLLVFPYLRRSVEGRAMHAVCGEMGAAARRQDGHRTWWPKEVHSSMMVFSCHFAIFLPDRLL